MILSSNTRLRPKEANKIKAIVDNRNTLFAITKRECVDIQTFLNSLVVMWSIQMNDITLTLFVGLLIFIIGNYW